MAVIGNSFTQQAFTPAIDYFSGNGSTTAFTLSRPVASVAQVQVIIDNVAQNPSSAYTVSSNTITFTSAPLSGTNNIYVYYTSPITQVIAPGQGTVTTTSLTSSLTLASPNITTALTLTGSAGTNGQYLTSAGSGAAPTWTTVASSQWTTTGSDIYYNTGNVSIGTAPSAWSGFKVLDVGSVSSLWGQSSGNGTSYYSNNLYYNGSARIYKTTGGASEYTQGGGTHQWYVASSGTAGNSVSLGERMRINSGGFFHATNSGSYPDGADTTYHYFTSDVSAGGSGDIVLYVRADSSSFGGRVFQVLGNRNTTNSSFDLIYGSNGNGSGKFIVRDSGNAVNTNNSYGAISDISLKENIVDATSKLADLMQVKIRNYNLKTKPDEKQIGVIAQELETVFPSLVESDNEGIKNVKYSVFVPMLIKAMQEQQELITAQAATITALTARITALENK